MRAKFNLSTPAGLASFIDFAEGIARQDLRRLLEANPSATGEDLANHLAHTAATHYQGAPGYWDLASGGFTSLTNDPVAERAAFVQVGNQLIGENLKKNA